MQEVTIEAKRPVKGSYNLNGPGKADKVLYREEIAKHGKYATLLELLQLEFPELEVVDRWDIRSTRESSKTDVFRSTFEKQNRSVGRNTPVGKRVGNDPSKWAGEILNSESMDHEEMSEDFIHYPVWKLNGRGVTFSVNGMIVGSLMASTDSLSEIARSRLPELVQISENLWNMAADDVVGIELMESPEYLWHYAKYGIEWNSPDRICIIEITVREEQQNVKRTVPASVGKMFLPGFTIPKTFYVPKYYPENIVDQAEYDVKPTLYWNPEVVTDKDGKAEINFPVGLKPRGLQIKIEGIDLGGGIGSTILEINTGKRYE